MNTSSTSPAVNTESPHLLAELKTPCEPVLAFYYSMGIAQNLLIYFLKSYCKGHFTAPPARHFSI